jgi:endonuclease YncB( thermonuclease family)
MSVVARMRELKVFCHRSAGSRPEPRSAMQHDRRTAQWSCDSMLQHFALALTLCFCAGTVASQDASPKASLLGIQRIVDGDTLIINHTHIRLEGIDAPETDQVCLDAKGARWTCGLRLVIG